MILPKARESVLGRLGEDLNGLYHPVHLVQPLVLGQGQAIFPGERLDLCHLTPQKA